jgi:hypothetical protein
LEGLKKRERRKIIVLFIISESLLKYSPCLDALGCLTDCHLSSAIYLAGGLQAH